jgi:hypothetical protein
MMTAVLRSRAIYKIAVGAQDCILKPKDGVLSLKYANSAQRIFQTDFLIEFGNHQIFASQKPRTRSWALKTTSEAKTL